MNDLGAAIYELFLDNTAYPSIMYNNGYYTLPISIVLFIPLLAAWVFYYVWNPIYGDWRHWLISIGSGALLGGALIYTLLNEYLVTYITKPLDYPDVSGYVWKFTVYSVILALLAATIWSFIIKWKSKKNKYQPL